MTGLERGSRAFGAKLVVKGSKPGRSGAAGAPFSNGTDVEVLQDEQGLRGSWFEGVVVDWRAKERKYLVRYKHLEVEDGSGKLLEEWISAGALGVPRHSPSLPKRKAQLPARERVRPLPPVLGSSVALEAGARVEARVNDGWWEGIVIEASVGGRRLARVQFPGEGDVQEVDPCSLRAAQHWDAATVKWTPRMLPGMGNGNSREGDRDEVPAERGRKGRAEGISPSQLVNAAAGMLFPGAVSPPPGAGILGLGAGSPGDILSGVMDGLGGGLAVPGDDLGALIGDVAIGGSPGGFDIASVGAGGFPTVPPDLGGGGIGDVFMDSGEYMHNELGELTPVGAKRKAWGAADGSPGPGRGRGVRGS
mmetsp:Transcript_60420/g.191905  ORF Transcript_60420/g.191905 Transcript_60420/m.191905 type:complete len:363 (-) Transcript_60420:6-1094(-)